MKTYLFARPGYGSCGVAGVAVVALSLRQARRYMRGSDYKYTGELADSNARHDYSQWWLVDAAKEYQAALESYVANGGGWPDEVRRDFCIPASAGRMVA